VLYALSGLDHGTGLNQFALAHMYAQDNADGLKSQLQQQQQAVDQLLGNTRVLESKLAEARSKKDTLKVRWAWNCKHAVQGSHWRQ
jgi:phage shock protein A